MKKLLLFASFPLIIHALQIKTETKINQSANGENRVKNVHCATTESLISAVCLHFDTCLFTFMDVAVCLYLA